MNNIESIFNPKSVAVVGVSQNPHKLGSVYFNNLIEGGYEGEIYPVNPKHEELFGYKSYRSVKEIPSEVEQVAILIPSKFVLDVVKDCAEKKVRVILIISAGFGETGEEGLQLENEILKIAANNNIRIIGPNVIGALCPKNKLNSSWGQTMPKDGNVAFVSQSGAFCTTMLDISLQKNLGFSHFLSIGNKIDVDEIDLLEYWEEDASVKAIGMYIEEIKYGQELIELAMTQNNPTPFVMYNPGKSTEAIKAIASHTGSMAGSVQTAQTAFEQAGIIEVSSTSELFNTLMTFSWMKQLPKGKQVAIVTNAGGPGIMATDTIVKHGLNMAKISPETQAKLKEVLPPAASVGNPVDVLGDAHAERYEAATNILMADDNVDMILYILTPQFITQIEETAKVIIHNAKFGSKPVYPVFLGEKYTTPGLQRMYDSKVPGFQNIGDAVETMRHNFRFYDINQSVNDHAINTKKGMLKIHGQGKYRDLINELMPVSDKPITLPEDVSIKLAEEIDLDVPKSRVCTNLQEALKFVEDDYPVVIKATSEAIVHKTDLKALYLDINDEQELSDAYKKLEVTIKKNTQKENPQILVQEMIDSDLEFLIGTNRDGGDGVYDKGQQGFGHLLAFGLGGIYTEVYKDIAYALVPCDRKTIENAVFRTRTSKILVGARGQKPLAFNKVVDSIEAIQRLVLLYPQIVSLDINPLLVTKDRAIAVDIKIFLAK